MGLRNDLHGLQACLLLTLRLQESVRKVQRNLGHKDSSGNLGRALELLYKTQEALEAAESTTEELLKEQEGG